MRMLSQRHPAGSAWFAAAIFVASGLLAPVFGSATKVQVVDIANREIDPFDAPPGTKAIVLLFVSTECPISNRYAPEIGRLHDTFSSKNVAFWLIYPNPAESPEQIRTHLKDFALPLQALRDPRHALVQRARVTVTPEAAVFDRRAQLLYHGRIDDRYVSFGVERPKPTSHDLAAALTAVVGGQPVPQAATQAIGCFVADFLR